MPQADKGAPLNELTNPPTLHSNLQNNPPTNVPQEDLASDHVLRALGEQANGTRVTFTRMHD